MPNGGFPTHMVLYPRHSPDHVIYCRQGTIHIFLKSEWESKKITGRPLASLDEREGRALAWFLRYWLGNAALSPGYDQSDVNVQFDL